MKEKINDIAEALTLAVSLKTGTVSELKELVCQDVLDKLVEWKWAGVPVQTFANRSDMAGGSTLGNISNTRVALNTVDIGLPQLAMHSPYETAGTKDTGYLIKAAEKFFL